MIDLSDYPVTTSKSRERLNERQLADYEAERRDCLIWLLTYGKRPQEVIGYAQSTVKSRSARMDIFYRFVWDKEGGYTVNIDHNHADDWMTHLAHRDVSAVHKVNCQKALRLLFKWRHHQRGLPEWEPEFRFKADTSSQPRDYLTREERSAIREAALEYGSIPTYNNLTPPERDRWRAYLAQRFEKPVTEVSPDDWKRANGWKFPSLVWTSLDTGLRPTEVERSVVSWIDTDNNVLRIPKEMSAKNREHWVVSITQRTSDALEKWLVEREAYEIYDGSDAIWLTREGNPYGVSGLRHVLGRLCEIAGIDTTNRSMSWYAIRHSVGTYMTREEDLSAAQAQLRHKSPKTTMKYDQAPIEDRRDALERMG